jgi:ketosteroid isomerase-like protein
MFWKSLSCRQAALAAGASLLVSVAACTTDSPPVSQATTPAPTAVDTTAEQQAIRQLLTRYAHSIDAADTVEAASVWLPSPVVSFIEPRGTEQGWHEIARSFYGQTMGQTFRKRALHIHPESIRLHVYPGMAWVMFDWDFAATFRASDKPLTSQGRETQVLQKTAQGWRIVHVHYSGPPITAAGRGF